MRRMWQWILGHVPQVEPGKVEIRDIANLSIASLTVFLAYVTIRLAKRQEDIGKRQNTITEKLASISIKQDRLFEQQALKKPELTLTLTPFEQQKHQETTDYRIHIVNSGKRSARDVHWSVGFAAADCDAVMVKAVANSRDMEKVEHGPNLPTYFSNSEPGPIYPGSHYKMLVGAVSINKSLYVATMAVRVDWYIACDDDTKDGQIALTRL